MINEQLQEDSQIECAIRITNNNTKLHIYQAQETRITPL